MLDQVKQKNAQIFVDHFNEVFGGKFDVECEWGFPVMILQFSSKNEEFVVKWRITVDVTKPDYSLQTYGAKLKGDIEIPQFATIDKTTLEFILTRAIMLSQTLFPQDKPNETEESNVIMTDPAASW